MSTANPLRIVFLGTPDFAVPTLTTLIKHGESVVAAVSQPDRPKGRGRKLVPTPVRVVAEAAGIPLLQPTAIRTDAFREKLAAFEPDLFVVAAYGRILPGPLLRLPKYGTINVHGSLLPRLRGAAPVQWAILNGDREAGITIMQMDEGLDTGDMLLARSIPIDDDDTAGTLAAKMAALGGELLVEALELLKAGKLVPQKQDDTLATLAPPLTKDLAHIDWTKSATFISCQIRGLDPWPLATTTLDGEVYRLFRPQVIAGETGLPAGTVAAASSQELRIATGDGWLVVREIQREGGKRLAVADFLRGRPLPTGARFV